MKRIILFLLLCMPVLALAQKPEYLAPVGRKETLRQGAAIIYGNFIQRLAFSSGGFPQDIAIKNISTGEVLLFRVKTAYKSAKQNIFCFHLPPGSYAILEYLWTKSKWYGAEMHREPVFKRDVPISRTGEQFTFTVAPNTIAYLGTWKFDTDVVSFEDAKELTDVEIKEMYRKIPFDSAVVALPH